MKPSLGYAWIAAAAALWGVAATVVKYLFNNQYDPLIIVQTRVTLACIALVLTFLASNRKMLVIDLRDIPLFLFVGICGVAGSNFFYYFAIKESNVATSILLQYTAPILVMLYVTVVQHERFTLSKFLALLCATAGIFFAVGAYDEGIIRANLKGVVFALIAAVTFAIFNIGGKPLTRKYSAWTVLTYVLAGASAFWLFINPPWTIASAGYSGRDWMVFSFISAISILLPYGFYFSGLKNIQASKAIITSMLEPVVAIISEVLFLDGRMSALQCMGAALVVGGIILLQVNSAADAVPNIAQE
ncbi:MAG: DMT family transporter [Acidobacteriota bacterium]